MRRQKLILILLLCASLLCGCTGQLFSPMKEKTPPEDTQFMVDVHSSPQSPTGETGTGTVYFRLSGADYLVGVPVEYELSFGESVEEALLKKLFQGPQGMQDLSTLFPGTLSLVAVNERNGYLEVVLSQALMADDLPIEEYMLNSTRNQMAVFSIVNTITELGRYSRVMFMVEENGTSRRMKMREAGFLSGDENPEMEYLTRETSWILAPSTVAGLVLDAMMSQSNESIDTIMRFAAAQSGVVLDETTIRNELFGSSSIAGYTLASEATISPDGKSAVVVVNYESLSGGQRQPERTGIALRLVRDANYIWKVDYDSLHALKVVTF